MKFSIDCILKMFIRPSEFQKRIELSLEHEAYTNGLSGWASKPYISAWWSSRTAIHAPILVSQIRIWASHDPEAKNQGISWLHTIPLTKFVCPSNVMTELSVIFHTLIVLSFDPDASIFSECGCHTMLKTRLSCLF